MQAGVPKSRPHTLRHSSISGQVVRTALDRRRVIAIELSEVELVDRDAVKLLAQAEAEAIELRSCPAYIREWVTNERTSI